MPRDHRAFITLLLAISVSGCLRESPVICADEAEPTPSTQAGAQTTGGSEVGVTGGAESTGAAEAGSIGGGAGAQEGPSGGSSALPEAGEWAPYEELPPRQSGVINAITKASPAWVEQGSMVNLWVEGREFLTDAELGFSNPDLLPADLGGMVEGIEVISRTASSDGELDGLIYYLRVLPTAALGPVDVTVQNLSSGSLYSAPGLITVVSAGEVIENGAEDVTAVTGASPSVVSIGSNATVWITGQGFNRGSTLQFSRPGIQQLSPSETVLETMNEGENGIYSAISIPSNEPAGPVNVTVLNPNGSSVTRLNAFELRNRTSAPPLPEPSACADDLELSVTRVGQLTPLELKRGEERMVELEGEGFSCRVELLISGEGVEVTSEVQRSTPDDDSALSFTVRVAEDATLGARGLTVVNANGSDQSNPLAFTVIDAEEGEATSTSCP